MRYNVPVVLFLSLGLSSSLAKAATITWTDWNPSSFQQTCPDPAYASLCSTTTSAPYNYYFPASATGKLGGVTVTMNGLFDQVRVGYPSFGPTSTFSGGTVGNAPPSGFNSIQLRGGLSAAANNEYYNDVISFSSPVTNPVIAIWSLGDPNVAAQFVFGLGQPFTIQSGGPSTEYQGQSISQSGEYVYGAEGNGTIQFIGTYSQIDFTTPVYEDYFSFTVGAPAATPEPSGLLLLGTGLVGLAGAARRRFAR